MAVVPVPGTSGASAAATVSTAATTSAADASSSSHATAVGSAVRLADRSGSASTQAAAALKAAAAAQSARSDDGVSATISMQAYRKQLEDVQTQIAKIRSEAGLTEEQRSIQLTSLDARQMLIETSIEQAQLASRLQV